jgi:hypothetical protein
MTNPKGCVIKSTLKSDRLELSSSSEEILDAAIECTFPASDPIAIQNAFDAACRRERTAREERYVSSERSVRRSASV